MLALIVPTTRRAELYYEFLRLRDNWPKQSVAIKGSKLSEPQTKQDETSFLILSLGVSAL